jgi:hypothetical protein
METDNTMVMNTDEYLQVLGNGKYLLRWMSIAMVVQVYTEHRVQIILRDVILASVIYYLWRVKGETTQQEQEEG